MAITIRKIEKSDNKILAELIRTVFREFKIDKPGTVYTDPTTDHLYELFQTPKSTYWVAEEKGRLLGGCGTYPTESLPEGYTELVKLYLLKEARGKGIGTDLLNKSINSAKEFGFKQMYLESFPELEHAVNIYKKTGFKTIEAPLGKSIHYACTLWMQKDL